LDGKEYLVGTGPEPAADSGNAQPSGVAARPGGYHSKKPAKRHRQYASNSALMRRFLPGQRPLRPDKRMMSTLKRALLEGISG